MTTYEQLHRVCLNLLTFCRIRLSSWLKSYSTESKTLNFSFPWKVQNSPEPGYRGSELEQSPEKNPSSKYG